MARGGIGGLGLLEEAGLLPATSLRGMVLALGKLGSAKVEPEEFKDADGSVADLSTWNEDCAGDEGSDSSGGYERGEVG